MINYLDLGCNSNNPRYLVVLLHGIGSDQHDLASLVQYFKNELENFYFISLRAPEEYDAGYYGFQWFSMKNRDTKILQEEISKTVPLLDKFLLQELQRLKLTHENLVLIGFSQGAMTSINYALSSKNKLCCVISFSGAVLPLQSEINNSTPICMIHGENDEIIPIEVAQKSINYLISNKVKQEFHIIPFLEHSIDLKSIKTATNFILDNIT